MISSFTDIADFESGEMDEVDVPAFFQGMINSGVVWQLQGYYGRTATALINVGECVTAADYNAAEAIREDDDRAVAIDHGTLSHSCEHGQFGESRGALGDAGVGA